MSWGDISGRRPLVAVNGLFLDHPHSGTGVYTREVLSRLLTPARDGRRYAVIGHPEHRRDLAMGGGYIPLQAPLRSRSDKLEKLLWEQATLPAAVARLRADLLYAPYFSLPLLQSVPSVVTVHDLVPLLLPEYAPSAGFKAYFRLVSAATRRAAAVVTDSQHSAADIARVLNVPAERIHVVYLGVHERFRRAAIAPKQVVALRERLGLPERFVLYLGGVDPRKNLGVLLRAMAMAREQGRRLLPLVMVARTSGRFADPRDEARSLGVRDGVIFLDGVSEDDKPALYAAAWAFAYPSRYEGFGLPPLEAMSADTPVLCSSASSLPEVVGDAGLLLDPDDVAAWAEALERIAQDDALHAALAERGGTQAALFTWEATTDGLRRVFDRVLA